MIVPSSFRPNARCSRIAPGRPRRGPRPIGLGPDDGEAEPAATACHPDERWGSWSPWMTVRSATPRARDLDCRGSPGITDNGLHSHDRVWDPVNLGNFLTSAASTWEGLHAWPGVPA